MPTTSKRDKLALTQIVKVFRAAQGLGEHEGFQMFAAICGYTAQLVDALKRASALKAEAEETIEHVRTLSENPKLRALMNAAHVNTEGMA